MTVLGSLAAPREGIHPPGRGKPFVTDGPYTESKELVGAFFIIEAKDMAEAVAIASKHRRPISVPTWAGASRSAPAKCTNRPRSEQIFGAPVDLEQRLRRIAEPDNEEPPNEISCGLHPDTKTAGIPPTKEHMAKMGKFVENPSSLACCWRQGTPPRLAAGARLQSSGGKITVIDGPFTESKEADRRFAILQSSPGRAIDMTKRFLEVAGDGVNELRQIMEPEGNPANP